MTLYFETPLQIALLTARRLGGRENVLGVPVRKKKPVDHKFAEEHKLERFLSALSVTAVLLQLHLTKVMHGSRPPSASILNLFGALEMGGRRSVDTRTGAKAKRVALLYAEETPLEGEKVHNLFGNLPNVLLLSQGGILLLSSQQKPNWRSEYMNTWLGCTRSRYVFET